MFNKSDIRRNAYQLFGMQRKRLGSIVWLQKLLVRKGYAFGKL